MRIIWKRWFSRMCRLNLRYPPAATNLSQSGSARRISLKNTKWIAVSGVAIVSVALSVVSAQPPAGGRGGGMGGAIFAALDADKDGSLTRAEMKSKLDSWYTSSDTAKAGAVAEGQLLTSLLTVFPLPAPFGFNVWGNSTPMNV